MSGTVTIGAVLAAVPVVIRAQCGRIDARPYQLLSRRESESLVGRYSTGSLPPPNSPLGQLPPPPASQRSQCSSTPATPAAPTPTPAPAVPPPTKTVPESEPIAPKPLPKPKPEPASPVVVPVMTVEEPPAATLAAPATPEPPKQPAPSVFTMMKEAATKKTGAKKQRATTAAAAAVPSTTAARSGGRKGAAPPAAPQVAAAVAPVLNSINDDVEIAAPEDKHAPVTTAAAAQEPRVGRGKRARSPSLPSDLAAEEAPDASKQHRLMATFFSPEIAAFEAQWMRVAKPTMRFDAATGETLCDEIIVYARCADPQQEITRVEYDQLRGAVAKSLPTQKQLQPEQRELKNVTNAPAKAKRASKKAAPTTGAPSMIDRMFTKETASS